MLSICVPTVAGQRPQGNAQKINKRIFIGDVLSMWQAKAVTEQPSLIHWLSMGLPKILDAKSQKPEPRSGLRHCSRNLASFDPSQSGRSGKPDFIQQVPSRRTWM